MFCGDLVASTVLMVCLMVAGAGPDNDMIMAGAGLMVAGGGMMVAGAEPDGDVILTGAGMMVAGVACGGLMVAGAGLVLA